MFMLICFEFVFKSCMSSLIQCWLHVLNCDVRVSGLDGLFAHVCFVFVLLCCAWSFLLVRKARSLFSGRVYSHIIYNCLIDLEFCCSIYGMFSSHTVL